MARFIVNYTFHATAMREVEADSLDEARAKVEADVSRDDFEIDADEIDDVDFHLQELHPVVRSGKKMWTTYPTKDDVLGHGGGSDAS